MSTSHVCAPRAPHAILSLSVSPRCLRYFKRLDIRARATDVSAESELTSVKLEIKRQAADVNRGIFGAPVQKTQEILGMIEQLEANNPSAEPTGDMSKLAGRWRVIYSSIKITGSKRTKLGLREFVKLGDMFQDIDTDSALAINEVCFGVPGFGLNGALTIQAKYKVEGPARVGVQFLGSSLTPSALQAVFEANYDLLLGIFNPDGWLDITYLDSDFRVGRDDKGNVFVLERGEVA